MRPVVVAMTIALLTALSARAEEQTPLPGIIVGAPPPPTVGPARQADATRRPGRGGGAQERCVDVAIGGEHSFGCLNDKLKKEVDRVNPTANVPPIDAKSSDLKVGVVNVPGVQQQYGRNFGVSVYPYRPAAPVFAPPAAHR